MALSCGFNLKKKTTTNLLHCCMYLWSDSYRYMASFCPHQSKCGKEQDTAPNFRNGRFIWEDFFCLFGFLTSSSTTRLYRGRAPRQSVWQFYVLPHTRQSWETMISVSAGHIILTPTQPVGSGRPQRESNPGPPHQESRALPTELPRPPIWEEDIPMLIWIFHCICEK